jgi:hypothetical protein
MHAKLTEYNAFKASGMTGCAHDPKWVSDNSLVCCDSMIVNTWTSTWTTWLLNRGWDRGVSARWRLQEYSKEHTLGSVECWSSAWKLMWLLCTFKRCLGYTWGFKNAIMVSLIFKRMTGHIWLQHYMWLVKYATTGMVITHRCKRWMVDISMHHPYTRNNKTSALPSKWYSGKTSSWLYFLMKWGVVVNLTIGYRCIETVMRHKKHGHRKDRLPTW